MADPIYKRDMAGRVFGRLTVVSREPSRAKSPCQDYWLCQCSCGTEKVARGYDLRNGHTMSCGCYNLDAIRARQTIHGKSGSKIFWIWAAMIDRCGNPRNKQYANYGGRGIHVCERWLEFANFLEDMGERPTGLTLERKNNDFGYSPDNCIWASVKAQNRNKRNNRVVVLDGVPMILRDAAAKLGINYDALRSRLDRGWPVEYALRPNGTRNG